MSTRFLTDHAKALSPITYPELEAYFHQAARPSSSWQFGAEFEKIAVYRATGQQLPYEGQDGIRQVLQRLADRFGWQAFRHDDHIIALLRDGATVTLEPGAQVELSSSVFSTVHELEKQVQGHLQELRAVVDPETVAWLAVGLTPYSQVDDIVRVPKERYAIMDGYLPPRSTYARHMMRATASIQASFDFSDEQDAVRKFLVAISLSPLINSMFGNSPLYAGQLTGDLSFRGRIWVGMDPDRSGFLSQVARHGEFSFQRWVDYLLDVPMMFYCINDVFTPAEGRTFRDFMAKGLDGYFPTLEDWEMHLTSIFPEVRLKKYIEVRGADCVRMPLGYAVPALWKGLLYDAQSLEAALEISRRIPAEERVEVFKVALSQGLKGQYQGRSLVEWNRELVSLAASGLRRQAQAGSYPEETGFLDPVIELLDRQQNPAASFLEQWPSIQHDPRAVVRALEY